MSTSGAQSSREPATAPFGASDRPTTDRTNLHRYGKRSFGIALGVAAACYFVPVLLAAIGLLLLLLLCARLVHQGRGRYIPNLYARDIRVYDDAYRAFIGRTLSDLRRCKIRGHTMLWEASRLTRPTARILTISCSIWASGSAGRRG